MLFTTENQTNDKSASAQDTFRNLIRFGEMLRPYWKNILTVLVCDLILTILNFPFPWLQKLLIDDVMIKQDISLLPVVIGAIFLLTIINAVLDTLSDYYMSFISHFMQYDLGFKFYRHLQKLSFSFYDSREVTEVLTRGSEGAESRDILISMVNTVITNCMYLALVPVIILSINWQLALLAGFTLPWMAFSFFVLSRVVKKYSEIRYPSK